VTHKTALAGGELSLIFQRVSLHFVI